jgi:hypothetical protein
MDLGNFTEVEMARIERTLGYRLAFMASAFRDRASYVPLRGLPDPRQRTMWIIHSEQTIIFPPWMRDEVCSALKILQ